MNTQDIVETWARARGRARQAGGGDSRAGGAHPSRGRPQVGGEPKCCKFGPGRARRLPFVHPPIWFVHGALSHSKC
jgi:hypothetical protein